MTKRMIPLMTLLLSFSLMFNAPTAEAKRFGGGKSFGQSHKTAPAQKFSAAPSQPTGKQASNQGSSRKGILGGMLGGLLAGGLIASLLSGGGFSGFNPMDFIILGLLAFVLFKLFRRMNQAKSMASHHGPAGHFQSRETSGQPDSLRSLFEQNNRNSDATFAGGFAHSSNSDVPMNLPTGFDLTAFLNEARDHYRTLQEAWNKNDLTTIREYVSASLHQQLVTERTTLSGDQHTEVMFVDAELGRADYTASKAEISIRFSGKYRDTVENVEEDITDIWHLERDLTQTNAPWLVVGIEA